MAPASSVVEQPARDQQGHGALAGVEQQGGQGQVLAARAQDVGRADIAGADVAHVAGAGGAGDDDAERDRAQQIAADGV
jgi:hypothetical protein